MASAVGMPLREFLRSTTHREYLTLRAWVKRQWNTPSRSDHYLMNIAAEIRRSTGPKRQPTLNDFKIPFIFRKPTAKPQTGLTREQINEINKKLWIGRIGGKLRIVTK